MKNKILTKVILVVVCVSVLVAAFVVPSFAYTYGNTSAYNNSVEQFTLPYGQIILENTNHTVTDVPGYFYLPFADYYGRGDRVLTSVDSVIDDQNVNFAVINSVTDSNVYENNGFVHGGKIKFKTFANSVNFENIYDLQGLGLENFWFDSSLGTSADSSIYYSCSFYLPNADLYEQYDYQSNTFVKSVPVRYYFAYYDYDGVYHETTFDSKYWLSNGNILMIPYFPDIIYPDLSQFGYPYRSEDVDIFQDMAYIDSCWISIYRDLCIPNFLRPSSEANIDSEGDYISRLLYPNYMGSSLDTVLDNFSETQYNNGYDTGYDEGLEVGREEGIDLGYDTGYDEGLEVGREEGIDLGYDRGYDTGYNVGYDTGFDTGYNEGSLNPSTPFDSILLAVTNFLNWEFIPGISISILFSVVVGVTLLIIFLKVFAGG